MDPDETLRLWIAAREHRSAEAMLEHGTDLANWLNEDGFEPSWTPEIKAAFWRWWDSTFDGTTEYHDEGCSVTVDGAGCSCGAAVARCPKCDEPMRACARGEPDLHCDACGTVAPAPAEPSTPTLPPDAIEVAGRVIGWLMDHEPWDPESRAIHARLLVDVKALRDALRGDAGEAVDALLAALEAAGIAEAGAGSRLRDPYPDVQVAADALRHAILAGKGVKLPGAREALEDAKDWLENHGAIYCEDAGGLAEPGLAGLLGSIRDALAGLPREPSAPPADPGEPWAQLDDGEDKADLVCGCALRRDEFNRVAWFQCRAHAKANPEDKPNEYRCPDCGDCDIEGTAWVHLNSDQDSGSEPPSDELWCPSCEDHKSGVCLVEKATGLCTLHMPGEPEGEKCRPKERS